MGFDLEAPKLGGELFRPGRWINVGDVSYVETPGCDDELVIAARCRDEERERWDDIPVTVGLPKSAP